jgi:hypothetical protein
MVNFAETDVSMRVDWLGIWSEYVKIALSEPFSRGVGDCCSFAAGWASIVSNDWIDLPTLTDDEAKAYLKAKGGMEQAVFQQLRPRGFRKVTEVQKPSFDPFNFGIVCFRCDNAAFPEGVGVVIRGRIATRIDNRPGLAWIMPISVQVGSVWSHPIITESWD